jgi:hypothetical protein
MRSYLAFQEKLYSHQRFHTVYITCVVLSRKPFRQRFESRCPEHCPFPLHEFSPITDDIPERRPCAYQAVVLQAGLGMELITAGEQFLACWLQVEVARTLPSLSGNI